MYELGRVDREAYLTRSAELDDHRKVLANEKRVPAFARHRDAIRTFLDAWSGMTPDEKHRVLALMFEEVRVNAEGDLLIRDLRPRADWKDYMKAALAKPRWGTERKRGPQHPRDTFVAAGIRFRFVA